jgi:hypothetical protein
MKQLSFSSKRTTLMLKLSDLKRKKRRKIIEIPRKMPQRISEMLLAKFK